MRKVIGYLLPFCLILLAGCASFTKVKDATNFDSQSIESIVIVGVEPGTKIRFWRGQTRSDGWHVDLPYPWTQVAIAEGGFITMRVRGLPSGKNYGLLGVQPEGFWGPNYKPCKGQDTLVFDAPAGKVVYIGEFTFSDDPQPKGSDSRADIERVRDILRQRYPGLESKLVPGNASIQTIVNLRCPRWYDYIPFII